MRNSPIIVLSILITGLFSSPATAENLSEDTTESHGYRLLSGDELLATHMEITLEGVYSPGSHKLLPDGSPVTFTEFHHKNSTTTYKHRGYTNYTSKGVFIVQKDRMCYMYNDPPNIIGRFCFYIFEKENCYYHYFAGAPMPKTKEGFENWSSMAYRREDKQTCLPDFT